MQTLMIDVALLITPVHTIVNATPMEPFCTHLYIIVSPNETGLD